MDVKHHNLSKPLKICDIAAPASTPLTEFYSRVKRMLVELNGIELQIYWRSLIVNSEWCLFQAAGCFGAQLTLLLINIPWMDCDFVQIRPHQKKHQVAETTPLCFCKDGNTNEYAGNEGAADRTLTWA